LLLDPCFAPRLEVRVDVPKVVRAQRRRL
jgi:hypothetical protein